MKRKFNAGGALLVAWFVVMLCGCSSAGKQAAETEEGLPVIDLSENVEQVSALNLSDAVERVEVVPLETTDESLIKYIGGIEVTENDIWVKNGNTNILRFSCDGKFRNAVGRRGQGPGEYTWAHSFSIDTANREVYVISASSGIFVYDYEGKFLRMATKVPAANMFQTPDARIILFENEVLLSRNLPLFATGDDIESSLWSVAVADSAFNFAKLFKNPAHIGREKEIASEEHLSPMTGWVNYWVEEPTQIDFYANDMTLKFPDMDTIYTYLPATQSLEPQYAIFTDEPKGDYGLTHEWVKERRALGYFTLSGYYPTKDYVYLTGSKDDEVYTYAYDKRDGSVRLAKRREEIIVRGSALAEANFGHPMHSIHRYFLLKNDLSGGTFKVDYRSQGKYWISELELGSDSGQERIKEIMATAAGTPHGRELTGILERADEEDNPILLIAVLK